jgi:hypothetical protein
MQHPTIKAIETTYKGYRFRSRLEARWAVFFDALGVKWEYEPEGFELPSGRYLPDFRLDEVHPKIPVYAEVKPEGGDAAKARALAEAGATVLLLEGAPWGRCYPLFIGSHMRQAMFFSVYDKPHLRLWEGGDASVAHLVSQPVWNAIIKARNARFEHGESGAAR